MDWILEKLDSFASRTACIEPQSRSSFKDLVRKINGARSSLSAIPKTAVVAVQTKTTLEGVAALLAIALEGKIALPLPFDLPKLEQENQIKTATATHWLKTNDSDFALTSIHSAQAPQPHALIKRFRSTSNASGLILFSSGTSGEPKAMLHNFDALLARYQDLLPRNDRSLLLLLIDHIGGLDSAFRSLFVGSTIVIPEERTPVAAADAIEKYKVNILPASPTFLNLISLTGVTRKHDCSSVEIVAYGAEPMPQNLLQTLGKTFPQAKLQQKFGTSETGAVRIKSIANDSLFFKITDKDTSIQIVEGQLWLKTPSRIIGYLNADESQLEADGWYRTGDLVEEGPDGSIRIIGRESATINVGGQKVHPAEIEAVISELPGLTACRVYAEADPITGNRVTCDLVPENLDESDPLSWKRAIRKHCRGRLAPWKLPSRLNIIPELTVNQRMKRK